MDNYDFSGWATRNDLKCSDGRIIRKDAFKHNDGMKVPMVWNHDHTDPYRVIGHALLENRDEGVYAYGKFNDTDLGVTAKAYVMHGDITALSIYANQLKQQGPNVMHGNIRELSLVLAGANPGAYIENVMAHGDEIGDEARIYTGLDSIVLCHADSGKNYEEGEEDMYNEYEELEHAADGEETIGDIIETMTEKQKNAVYALIAQMAHADEDDENMEHADDETIEEIIEGMTEKQQEAVYAVIGSLVDDDDEDEDDSEEDDEDYDDEEYDDDEVEHSEGGDFTMKHNVFDQEEMTNTNVLTHADMQEIFADAQRMGSLRDAVLSHGIEDIEILFPDAKALNAEPDFIKRDDLWVNDVLNSAHHSPFTRIKTVHADITADDARAKGYTKGKQKIEEVFKLLKRVTTPTTIYKKQKLDRDDLLDIKEFDTVAWMKKEMRWMLNEELARAILFGDGRTELSEDKISETNIRPIWTDDDLYSVKVAVNVPAGATEEEMAKAFIKNTKKSRKLYKGSGNPVMFISEDLLTDCLLLEDLNGRVIYDTIEKLAAALRVRKLIPVPVMENLTRDVDGVTHTLGAIYVNMADYNVGTDKGGEVNMFDDFDIDYNQYKYLMETRCSGALTKPFSAVVVEFVPTTAG